MSVDCVRPKVADLVFHLYAKPLHPELFDTLALRRVERDNYEVEARITRTGHVISWHNSQVFLTEVMDIDQEFPQERRCIAMKLRGERTAQHDFGHGVTYETTFQVETLPPDIFVHVHDEILAEGAKKGLLHNFQPNHRLAIAPLGFITVEARPGVLFLSSFHTFPEEHAVVKSQSLIEYRPGKK